MNLDAAPPARGSRPNADRQELEPAIVQTIEDLATSRRPIDDDDKLAVDVALNDPLTVLAAVADNQPGALGDVAEFMARVHRDRRKNEPL